MSQENKPYGRFTQTISWVITLLDPNLTQYYQKNLSLFNYAFVCGVGVLINMTIIQALFNLGLGLVVSNAGAILIAFLWNWTFSVGPYGYLFDLGEKHNDK